MAGKKKAPQSKLSLQCAARHYYGYAEYFARVPLFSALQVVNGGSEAAEGVDVTLENADGFLLPYSRHLDAVPFESSVELAPENVVSPLYLAELADVAVTRIAAVLTCGKERAEAEAEVTVLPFDMWSGRSGSAELLAGFVRPKVADCLRILDAAQEQLKKWEIACEWRGYAEGDKTAVRRIAAALFAAVKKQSVARAGDARDLEEPVSVAGAAHILRDKSASALEMALFFASCLECAGLHPVLAFGSREVACGVWLYDNCFADGASDDVPLLQKYVADGINNVAMYDTDDLFAGRSVNATAAEKHFARKLEAGCYDTVVDVRRCRLARVLPLPLKAAGARGVELLGEEDTDLSAAPAAVADARKVSLDGKITKDKQWERRLLDLSLKNALLHFRPEKNALHVAAPDLDALRDALAGGSYALAERTADMRAVLADEDGFAPQGKLSALSELLGIELKNGRLRTFADAARLDEVLRGLQRKARTAEEETGANVLFLALGFLRWYESDTSREPLYAPLVLWPMKLSRGKGGKGFALSPAGELQVNTTLLEFLMREYKIDIRGLDSHTDGLRVSEILAMVRAEILDMKRWSVQPDAYLAAFSFARYAMWNDVRRNIGVFRQNPLVASLLENRLLLPDNVFEGRAEDDYDPGDILCPLTADGSQFEAVAEAVAGSTFVLHGPPGTGKSQTITNIIANCLCRGKRVLFVAEKQAALSVVKKRLDSIGLGEFCLEMHAGKADKAQLLKDLEGTLSLAREGEEDFAAAARRLGELRASLNAPVRALHRKRRLGCSVYEAALLYLENKSAPDVLDIESTFYDRLTKEKLDRCEGMLAEAAAAARQCGGVHRSPFENVGLRRYDASVRSRVYYAAEGMLVEVRHLRDALRLLLDFFRQKVSAFTPAKMRALLDMIERLHGEQTLRFFRADEGQLRAFFRASRRLDASLREYFSLFRTLVDLDADPDVVAQELENRSEARGASRLLASLAKKLRRAALEKMSEEEAYRRIGLLAGIHADMRDVCRNTELSANFTDRGGRINFRRRAEFMRPLEELHALAASVFMDYNADSFNDVCAQAAAGGYLGEFLDGFRGAADGFRRAAETFCTATCAARDKFADEDVLDYFRDKASALVDNIDMLAAWCRFRDIACRLDEEGLTFITASLASGAVTAENMAASFRKNVYRNFIETNVAADPVLSAFSSSVLDEQIEQFRALDERFTRLSRAHIRAKLIAALPDASTEGPLSVEVFAFRRIAKGNMRGMTPRELFAQIPALFARLAPCVLMSPTTVAQHLAPQPDLFDVVVFDEASQMPTCEAVGALARGRSAVIVGDPKQMPPTSFFASGYVDEENLDAEDLESILDDCLALSIPEKHLNWHYRSKHESLIAFSNVMYYGNRLCTFPSPDALESKVRLAPVADGVYERGGSKRNRAEADALVAEVVRRLSDEKLRRSSIGVVTFSSAQQDYIERRLSEAILKNRLEAAAYEREEPLFVKNLENVQGDERDVILFSVCYGPDRDGRVALNFGPLNQQGGWRRLNVAVSRAREEMVVFSSMTSAMIDLARTNSKGVAGLKAFLEFAEKGKTSLAIGAEELSAPRAGLGRFLAEELSNYGYDCRADLGVSDFKIDCAVLDPRGGGKFILAILCDGPASAASCARDRSVLQVQTLKRNNWNVLRLYTLDFLNNPKREIKRIKETLDRLTGAEKGARDRLGRYRRAYRFAKLDTLAESAAFVTGGGHDAEIAARLKAIVAAEEPIGEAFLIERCLDSLGIRKGGARVEERLRAIIAACHFRSETLCGRTYYRKTDKCLAMDFFRTEEEPTRASAEDFTPYEVIALARGILENKVSLYADELNARILAEWKVQRPGDALVAFLNDCIALAVDRALFVRSVSDRISLA